MQPPNDQLHLTINLATKSALQVLVGIPSEHGLKAVRAFVFTEDHKRVTFWAVQHEINEVMIRVIAQWLVNLP